MYAYLDAVGKTTKGNKNTLLNKIGYHFLKERAVENAVIVFQESVELFPDNANAWDSLGEAYVTGQDKENAVKSYRKALELALQSGISKNNASKTGE